MVELEIIAPPEPPPQTPLDGAVNILLVDDESRNLDVLQSLLESPELRLVRAENAEQALLALVRWDITVIVLDVHMPGMTGFELARLIKQRKRSREIPIIFLTAYYQEDTDALCGYDAGAVDYLTKPVDPRILKSKLNVFVELSRAHRALVETNRVLQREIAERQQAQVALSRLAAIVEYSSDAIVSRDLDGTILTWNQAAERLFGYTATEILGRPIALLIPADRAREREEVVNHIHRGETVETFETIRLRKDGARVAVSVTLSPIKGPEGGVTGVSAIYRDIGERKRLEAEVLQATEREQRRIAQDLHDGLGQQLAGISCLSGALKRDLERAAPVHAAAAGKISKLLDLAVVGSRNLARGLHPIPPEPNGLVSALEHLASSASDLFHVRCTFDCSLPVMFENYDAATDLYRIAQEAVTNAIKHGQADQIEISLSSVPGRIILVIRNNGLNLDSMANVMRQQQGMGLRIMHYRAGRIGGSLAFQQRDTGGMELLCTMPTTGKGEASR
jgi:PAS domain S-box-containing protein